MRCALSHLYLAFEDRGESGNLSDTVVSANGDSEKVLATVVATVYLFTDKFPGCAVFATGSTPSRTRMYRIGITKYLEIIKKDFDLYGLLSAANFEQFQPGTNYSGFLVIRKNSILAV